MRRVFRLILLSVLGLSVCSDPAVAGSASPSVAHDASGRAYVAGELVYLPCRNEAHAHWQAARRAAEVFRQFPVETREPVVPRSLPVGHPLRGVTLVRFQDHAVDVQRVCHLLSQCKDVEFAQPNYAYPLAGAGLTVSPGSKTTKVKLLKPRRESVASKKTIEQTSVSSVAAASVAGASVAGSPVPDPLLTHAGAWGLEKIEAPAAWQTSRGQGVVVAVIDTGVDYTHPDLAANMWQNPGEVSGNGVDDDRNGYVDDIQGWNFNDDNNDPRDDSGHGTHVAGIIAAVEGNGIGIAGVAPSAKIMALEISLIGNSVLEDPEPQPSGATDGIAAALDYAAANGARVINLSLSGFDQNNDEVFRRAWDFASSRGCVLVWAAGNSNRNVEITYGANDPRQIVVGATTSADAKHGFSNFGATVDVMAPGNAILSLLASNSRYSTRGGIVEEQYLSVSGTSMACPHVAGIAALVVSRRPDWTPERVRSAIRLSAEDLGPSGPDSTFGHGRVNARRALSVEPTVAIRLQIPTVDAARRQLVFRGTLEGAPPSSLEVLYRPSASQVSLPLGFEAGDAAAGELARVNVTSEIFQNGTRYVFLFRVPESTPSAFFSEAVVLQDLKALEVFGANGLFFNTRDVFLFRANSIFGIASATWRRLPDGTEVSTGLTVDSHPQPPGWRVTVGIAPEGLAGEGAYSLRLTDQAGFWHERIFYLEASVFGQSFSRKSFIGDTSFWPSFLQLSELDGDPARELVVVVPDFDAGLSVRGIDHAGSMLWRRVIGLDSRVQTAVDLDRDGLDEIIRYQAPNERILYISRAQDQYQSHSEEIRLQGHYVPRAAADLDGNGDLEILLLEDPLRPSESGSPRTDTVSGEDWSALGLGFFVQFWAVGDLDKDGQVEIIVRDGTTKDVDLVILSASGTVLRRIPAPASLSGELAGGAIALADVDGDSAGDLEIVAQYVSLKPNGLSRSVSFRSFDADGTERNDFQVSLPANSRLAPDPLRLGFSLGDLTGDRLPELVVYRPFHGRLQPEDPYLEVLVAAYERSGDLLAGWPVSVPTDTLIPLIQPLPTPRRSFACDLEPLIADVNADGRNDVVVVHEDGKVYAYGASGAVLPGWPRTVAADIDAFPKQRIGHVHVGDLEGDGFSEILLYRDGVPKPIVDRTETDFETVSTIHVLPTFFPHARYRDAWPFAHHDPARTRNFSNPIVLGNRLPVFDAFAREVTVFVGNPVQFEVVVRDEDGDPLTVAFEGVAPSGATLRDLGELAAPAKGRRARFEWTPSQASVTSVAFAVSDGMALVRSQPVLITARQRESFTRSATSTNGKSKGWTLPAGGGLQTIKNRAWVKYSLSFPSAGVWELEVQAFNEHVGAGFQNSSYDLEVKSGAKRLGTLSMAPQPDGVIRSGTISLGSITSRKFPKKLTVTLTWANGTNSNDFKLRLSQLVCRKVS